MLSNSRRQRLLTLAGFVGYNSDHRYSTKHRLESVRWFQIDGSSPIIQPQILADIPSSVLSFKYDLQANELRRSRKSNSGIWWSSRDGRGNSIHRSLRGDRRDEARHRDSGPRFRNRSRCVFSSEKDVHARQTYAANFMEEPFGDILEMPLEKIPEHDILLAGFPCQPFSIAESPSLGQWVESMASQTRLGGLSSMRYARSLLIASRERSCWRMSRASSGMTRGRQSG